MPHPVSSSPAGYHPVNAVHESGCAAAIDYRKAFNAEKTIHQLDLPAGKVVHSDIRLGTQ